jgi:GT2 family glycosyltransferase
VNTLSISVVIPVFNGRERLEKLLKSIAQQTADPLEVLVVDNGSVDGAPEVARREGARVIAMGRNAGFAAAVNRGIAEAKGEAIALINSDVELEAGWLTALWSGMERTAADFGTGKILSAEDGESIDGTYDLICRGGCAWRAGSGQRDRAGFDAEQTIRFCPATAAIYRASVFRAAGRFEESFESYLEDVELGLRMAAAKLKGGYFPEAVSRHWGSATFGRWNPRVVRLMARNQVFLVARHYPAEILRRWIWPVMVAQLLWGAVALRHGCGMAYVRGKIEGLRGFGRIRGNYTQSAALAPAIAESERQIYQLQKERGFETYWKLYFRLAGVAR